MGVKRTCSEQLRDWAKWAKVHTRSVAKEAIKNMKYMTPAFVSTTLLGLADRFFNRQGNLNRYYREHFDHALGESEINGLTGAVMVSAAVTHLAEKKITTQFKDENHAEVARSILGLGVVAAIALPLGYSAIEAAVGYGAYRGFELCRKRFVHFVYKHD